MSTQKVFKRDYKTIPELKKAMNSLFSLDRQVIKDLEENFNTGGSQQIYSIRASIDNIGVGFPVNSFELEKVGARRYWKGRKQMIIKMLKAAISNREEGGYSL